MALTFPKPPVIWDEKVKYDDFFEVDAESFNRWTQEVMKAFVGMKTHSDPFKAEQANVGDDKVFYWRELDGLGEMTVYPFGGLSSLKQTRRVSLETMYGGKMGKVYFSGKVLIPILANRPDIKTVWMSLTPMEIFTQRGGLRKARGHVLIGGLGLGWLARRCMERGKVKSVTVYEKDPAVAKFFGDPLIEEFGDKFKVVTGNIYDADHMEYDTFLCDIWKGYHDAAYDKKFLRIAAKHPNAWAWGAEWRTEVDWMKSTIRNEERKAANG